MIYRGLIGFDVNVETDLRNHRDESCCIKRGSKTTNAETANIDAEYEALCASFEGSLV